LNGEAEYLAEHLVDPVTREVVHGADDHRDSFPLAKDSEFCPRRASFELAVDGSVRFDLVTEEAVWGILDRVFAFGLDAS
jgi:hypothetical protein